MNVRGARRRAADAGAAIPVGLAVAAYALALGQRIPLDSSDTKINLHVDPSQFLGQAAAVWNRSGGLGHVQSGQYPGYLWPMGPFFALGHLIGIPDWVCQRLWLGTLLALAAWGAVRLMDALYERRRGVAQLVAGALYMVNPYVVVVSGRTTVFLLAYAALPWLLLVAHRGLREPRRWWWPAAFALLVTSTAGGVNATVTAFVLAGPVVLAAYEAATGAVSMADLLAFAWRAVTASVAASVWWVIPLLVQSHYGLNFLAFTEPSGAIWGSTSLSESLRLMGYWPTYLGTGFTSHLVPYFGNAQTMLFDPVVVVCTLLVPALALSGYLVTRRWRYGPFFLLLALLALLFMSVGWPAGTPGRGALNFLYVHLSALRFLRTTYKAGPLLAVSIAALAGAATAVAWDRFSGGPRLVAVAAGAALMVLWALPLFQGRALELTWRGIPAAWRQAGAELNRTLPANSRAIVLPGQEYAYYTWGSTIDPVLPALTRRPVAIRNVPPFDDLHAVDLLWTVDDLVQQDRLLPGQLRPLLDLMSARAVVVGSDDARSQSGAVDPATAAQQLVLQPGFARPTRSYGPLRTFPGPPLGAARPVRLPEVRRYDLPGRGLVRIEPVRPVTVVDGSAEGLASISALDGLPTVGPLFYAGDETAATIRRQASAGAQVFITDSNRRRIFVASRVLENYGWTISADQGFPTDSAVVDPFSSLGPPAQTVATFQGARDIEAPYNPQLAQFPEHRPYAAFDGNPATAWLADPTLDPSQQWIQIDLDRPRNIDHLDVLPYQPGARALQAVTVDGETFQVHPGWNRLAVRLRNVDHVRVSITRVNRELAIHVPSVGLAEVRIAGVRVTELLRVPVLAERALRGANLSHTPITYVFQRTTAPSPLRRGVPRPPYVKNRDRLQQEAALISQARDPENGISRLIDPPVARRWTLSGLANVSGTAPDPALDRLAGSDTHGWVFSSSGRLQGLAGFRASSAFDGTSSTAWVTSPITGRSPWISWTSPAPRTLRRLRLLRGVVPVRFPTWVAIAAGSSSTGPLPVTPGGHISLPRPLRGRSFRLTVLRASATPPGTLSDTTALPGSTIGIADVLGTGAPQVSSGSAIHGRCGDLVATLDGHAVDLRARGSVRALNAGDPLTVTQCGTPIPLPAVGTDVLVAPHVVQPLLIQLRSPAPEGRSAVAVGGGSVTDSGSQSAGSYTGVRVSVHGSGWLVLGESYSRGWTATCQGRSLGPPRVIDAFANGWPVSSRCHLVTLTFAPQRTVDYGYVVGGLACLVLALVLVLGRAARRDGERWLRGTGGLGSARPLSREDDGDLSDRRPRARPAGRALAGGLVGAALIGFLFGLRAGAVAGPVYALILWRGVPNRRLILAAAGLLCVVVPLIYLFFTGQNQGGYDDGYASQHLAAHWVTVGAFALLAMVLLRDLRAMRPREYLRRRMGRSTM